MRIRNLTTFFILFTSILTANADADWATLRGQFIYGDDDATELPTPRKLAVATNQKVCCEIPLFDESLIINEENRGIKNIYIWAYKPDAIHPDFANPPEEPVRIDNLKCRFEPHATWLRTGQKLKIGNLDNVGHNAFVHFFKNQPIGPLIPPGKTVDYMPTKAEILPMTMSCSFHPWMQGTVLVQDHPYVAITDEDGKFELRNLPAGDLTLKIWHEKIGYVKTFTLDGEELVELKRGKYTIALAEDTEEEHQFAVDPTLFADKR